MNGIFLTVALISLILICIVSPEATVGIMVEGGIGAIELSLKMLAIYCVWTSVLKMMEKSGLTNGINKLFAPFTNRFLKTKAPRQRAI